MMRAGTRVRRQCQTKDQDYQSRQAQIDALVSIMFFHRETPSQNLERAPSARSGSSSPRGPATLDQQRLLTDQKLKIVRAARSDAGKLRTPRFGAPTDGSSGVSS